MNRIVVLLILMFLSRSTSAYESVFYCTYQNDECVESSDSINVERSAINRILKNVIAGEENFIGFIDSAGTTIQFYVDKLDKIWVEIPSPEDKGSFGKQISNKEMMLIIKKLKEPYLPYKKTLGLKLTKW